MAKETTNISIRMDKELKKQAEYLFSELGMNLTTAFGIFVRQSVRQGKIPFDISLGTPNPTTLAAMQQAEDMRCGNLAQHPQSVSDFLKEMEK